MICLPNRNIYILEDYGKKSKLPEKLTGKAKADNIVEKKISSINRAQAGRKFAAIGGKENNGKDIS